MKHKQRPLFLAICFLTIFAGLIPSASADDLPPVLYVPNASHSCEAFNGDNIGNIGIICADLVTGKNANGTYWVQPQAEAICENSQDVIVQCANVKIVFELVGPSGTIGATEESCGHAPYPLCANPANSSGRNIWGVGEGIGETFTNNINNCSGNVDLPTQVQTVILTSGYGSETDFEMPTSGADAPLEANFGGGHYFICPSS
jgi:hypothetical protein